MSLGSGAAAALALGAAAARARRTNADTSHRLADLEGASLEAIVGAFAIAILVAHPSVDAAACDAQGRLCRGCLRLLALARRFADPSGSAWPNPFDAALGSLLADALR
jgi:hypothetical protein